VSLEYTTKNQLIESQKLIENGAQNIKQQK